VGDGLFKLVKSTNYNSRSLKKGQILDIIEQYECAGAVESNNIMKTHRFLCLILFLTIPSLSEELMLYINDGTVGSPSCLERDGTSPHAKKYTCVAGKDVRKKIILKKAVIELEVVIIEYIKYVPKNVRRKMVLTNKMNRVFLNDINKMTLVTRDIFSRFCYEISIYDHKNVITTFETDGYFFYDRKNKLMYESKEDLLGKHWDIFEESHCR
jgi:hypothetical protein